MKAILFVALFSVSCLSMQAQTFLDKGSIQYEVKSNIKKIMGGNAFEDLVKDKIPTFRIGYYTLTFNGNKSIYKWDSWDEKAKMPDFMGKDGEGDSWYVDHDTKKVIMEKNVIGTPFNIADTLPKLEWRITSESREIAGFNCRKAVTKIFDSVYVFAFYTDEILLPGGPCNFNGLPGTIMGITIPRLFTSWIATKVSVNGVDYNKIKPVESKKYFTNASMLNTIDDRTKDWYSPGGAMTDENRQQRNRFLWMTML